MMHMVLKLKSSLSLCHHFSGMNLVVCMVLLLEVVIVKSYGCQGQILLVAVPSFHRDDFYGAYNSLT